MCSDSSVHLSSACLQLNAVYIKTNWNVGSSVNTDSINKMSFPAQSVKEVSPPSLYECVWVTYVMPLLLKYYVQLLDLKRIFANIHLNRASKLLPYHV